MVSVGLETKSPFQRSVHLERLTYKIIILDYLKTKTKNDILKRKMSFKVKVTLPLLSNTEFFQNVK